MQNARSILHLFGDCCSMIRLSSDQRGKGNNTIRRFASFYQLKAAMDDHRMGTMLSVQPLRIIIPAR